MSSNIIEIFNRKLNDIALTLLIYSIVLISWILSRAIVVKSNTGLTNAW